MNDEKPAKKPRAPRKKVKPEQLTVPALAEAERARRKHERESRIEHIASLMRMFVNPDGSPTWNRKIRKALAASWGITDVQMRTLSAIASKRVCKEVADKETLTRNIGVVVDGGLRDTYAKKDWRNLVQLATVGLKMVQGPAQTEVTVKEQKITPAMAAAAVKEFFGGAAAKKDDEVPVTGQQAPAEPERAEPADGTAEAATEEGNGGD